MNGTWYGTLPTSKQQDKACPTGWLPYNKTQKVLEEFSSEYKGVIKMLMTSMIGVDQEGLENSKVDLKL